MQTITAFFEAKAAYFSAGDFDLACSTSVFPTTVNLNGKVLSISMKEEMVNLMEDYRSSLMVWGYDHSETEILWSVSNTPETTTVGIKWRNVDAAGKEISQMDAVYHCKSVNDQWLVLMSDLSAKRMVGLHHLM